MMYHKEDTAALHFGRNETMYQRLSTEKERAGRGSFGKETSYEKDGPLKDLIYHKCCESSVDLF